MENTSKIKYSIYSRSREIPRLKTHSDKKNNITIHKPLIINEKNGYLSKVVLKQNHNSSENIALLTIPNARKNPTTLIKNSNHETIHYNHTPNKQWKVAANLPTLSNNASNGSFTCINNKKSFQSLSHSLEHSNNSNGNGNSNSNSNSNSNNQLYIILSLKSQLKRLNQEIEIKNHELTQLKNSLNNLSSGDNCAYYIQSQDQIISSLTEQNKKWTREIEAINAKKEENQKRKKQIEKCCEDVKKKEQDVNNNPRLSEGYDAGLNRGARHYCIRKECSLNYECNRNDKVTEINSKELEVNTGNKNNIWIPKLISDDKWNDVKTILGGDVMKKIEEMKDISVERIINDLYSWTKKSRNENDELYLLTHVIMQLSNKKGILDKSTLIDNMKSILGSKVDIPYSEKKIWNQNITNSEINALISTMELFDKYSTGYLQYFEIEKIFSSQSWSKDLTRNILLSIKQDEEQGRGKEHVQSSVLNIKYTSIKDKLEKYRLEENNENTWTVTEFMDDLFNAARENVARINMDYNQIPITEEIMVSNFVNDVFSCCNSDNYF